MRGILLALLTFAATSALAQDDAAFLREMRRFADITAGRPTGSPTPVDKLLRFDRRDGRVILTTIAIASPGDWPALPAGGIAVMRVRMQGSDGNQLPMPADFSFVRRTGSRLFVVGEWSLPARMWEIASEAGSIQFREIDASGLANSWRVAPGAIEGAAH